MTSASQTTITGLSSMATRHILADLARDYELLHKVRVEIRPLGGVEAAKLVRAGERTDIVVLASKIMQSLEAEGHIAPGSISEFRAIGDRPLRSGPARRSPPWKANRPSGRRCSGRKEFATRRVRAAIT